MTDMQASGENPIRVMIVDDHKSIVWGLERLVESAQPRMQVVGTATSCAGMLAMVSDAKPDVILLDLDLNGENSADALPDLQRMSQAKVLILTGARDADVQQAAIMKGARGVVGKDESAEVLLLAIERVHAGEVWINRMMMGRVLGAMTAGAGQSRATPEATRIASLTQREHEIIRAIVRNRGDKSNAIADVLHISEHTLRNHLTVIYEKLGVRNRLDLFAYAVEHGLAAG
jgi:two-component system, NarL family, nitrate/nitrite response regulator NarL